MSNPYLDQLVASDLTTPIAFLALVARRLVRGQPQDPGLLAGVAAIANQTREWSTTVGIAAGERHVMLAAARRFLEEVTYTRSLHQWDGTERRQAQSSAFSDPLSSLRSSSSPCAPIQGGAHSALDVASPALPMAAILGTPTIERPCDAKPTDYFGLASSQLRQIGAELVRRQADQDQADAEPEKP